ncbi:hypothetical protein KKD70_01015 [Patescibacteria group bacterium]|nr:hypothetical protein [Patescibacteria group bacterium]
MQKTTIFFIGTTVIVLMITGTVLGVRFAIRHSTNTASFVEPVEEQIETPIEEEIETPVEEEIVEEEIVENEPNGETDTAVVIPTSIDSVTPSIVISAVQEAGFKNATLPIASFDGTIFDVIDMKDYVNESHLEYQIIENDEIAAFMTEFNLLNSAIAQEVYDTLKEKIGSRSEFKINETNQYGNASFFANNSAQTDYVFLVVKKENRLYTCHYPAKNHNKIKNLITSL